MDPFNRMERTDREPLSLALIEAIAECDEIDPTQVDIPLYRAIDPDALDALFAPKRDGTPRDGGRIEFEYGKYGITINSDEEIAIRERHGGERVQDR